MIWTFLQHQNLQCGKAICCFGFGSKTCCGIGTKLLIFKNLTLPKSLMLRVDITFISNALCGSDSSLLHQYTVHVLEPVISSLDKPHHLLWVTTINYSQSDNPPQRSLVLVNHAKSCYTFGYPKLQCITLWDIFSSSSFFHSLYFHSFWSVKGKWCLIATKRWNELV